MNRIKILLVAPANERNTFIRNLTESLSFFADVICDEKEFWKPNKTFDILFLQWPERLSFRIGRKPLPPTKYRVNKISQTLDRWKTLGTKVLITRHNYLPHHYSTKYKELYYEIYKKCDAIHHFGSTSQEDYKSKYPDLSNKHVVINHNGYWDIPNSITKKEARLKLGIPDHHNIILAFGSLRIKRDEDQIIEAFKKNSHKNQILIIPQGYYKNENILYRILAFLKIPIYKYLINKKSNALSRDNIRWSQSFIPKNDIQLFLKASDLLVISRSQSLNSGILYLGLTFGNVICGPRSGNIGELLHETGNVTFEPNDITSITTALSAGLELSLTDQSSKNLKFANSQLSNEVISTHYAKFVRNLLGNHD